VRCCCIIKFSELIQTGWLYPIIMSPYSLRDLRSADAFDISMLGSIDSQSFPNQFVLSCGLMV
jgi:hypothetical protein